MEPANSSGNLHAKDSDNGSGNRLLLILSLVTFCLALAAFIMASVSLARGGDASAVINLPSDSLGSGRATAQLSTDDDKVWLLHLGQSTTNFEYLDEESGTIKGFNPDIVNAVCRIANKNCKLVFDIYTNCWDHVAGETSRGGHGMMAGWYDSCAAWFITPERLRTFAFSDPFTRSARQAFVTRPGNPDGFDWRDLTSKKIGFIDSFSVSKHCIANYDGITGNQLTEDQIFHCVDYDECYDALIAEEVDALFMSTIITRRLNSTEAYLSEEKDICDKSGFGMMTRYDGKLIEWWNPAQEKLLASKEYREICQDVKESHGHKPGLDPEDFCIGL